MDILEPKNKDWFFCPNGKRHEFLGGKCRCGMSQEEDRGLKPVKKEHWIYQHPVVIGKTSISIEDTKEGDLARRIYEYFKGSIGYPNIRMRIGTWNGKAYTANSASNKPIGYRAVDLIFGIAKQAKKKAGAFISECEDNWKEIEWE